MSNIKPFGRLLVTMLCAAAAACAFGADTGSCAATPLPGVGGKNISAWKLADGGIAAYSGMNINIDGYGRAYHPKNREAGAVLHLCVGGRVWLPNGSSYEGSESNATCTGKFMADMERIAAAGWTDAAVGAVQWYGIAAQESVTIAGRKLSGVKPVLQRDGSGFYVSPTSLVDRTVSDIADQRRYVNPLRVASAVVPSSLVKAGIGFGSFGVAIHNGKQIAVPFIVGDGARASAKAARRWRPATRSRSRTATTARSMDPAFCGSSSAGRGWRSSTTPRRRWRRMRRRRSRRGAVMRGWRSAGRGCRSLECLWTVTIDFDVRLWPTRGRVVAVQLLDALPACRTWR